MLTFEEIICRLNSFWKEQGCTLHRGHDLELGAGTFNPVTFFRSQGPEPYRAVYTEPSRRPADGRYGENPNRLQFFHQYQVLLKPAPSNIRQLYLDSLSSLGLQLDLHDLRFVHDDWEQPSLGAAGLGWEVWLDGLEITQFTYFQQMAGIELEKISVELALGLERLAIYLQQVDNIMDVQWNRELSYGDLFEQSEREWGHYNFGQANVAMWQNHFQDYCKEACQLLEHSLPIPAYDFVIKASHAFNLLDARHTLSPSERTRYIFKLRNLAQEVAKQYLQGREERNFPLTQCWLSNREAPPILPPRCTIFKKRPKIFSLKLVQKRSPLAFSQRQSMY